ncbi:MAG: hypothetical protein HGA19_24825, partial [Oscillochloris sp.]|nr:hypothetical protein [Oscillochloris sp.]
MDSQLILLILATLAIGLLASMLLLWRRRTPSIHSPPSPSATVVGRQHKEGVNEGVSTVAAAPRTKPRMITPAGALVIILPLLILGTVGWFFYNQITTNAADRFVVLVAYFDDGGDGATGRNVAEALARQITQQVQRQITVSVIAEHPTDTQAALKLANAQQSDVLIWGSVEPGAMLDSQSLSPNLIYTPNGAYAPNGWDGYLGRFAIPHSYTLASEPINGQVVLPYLVEVLFDYGQGQSDRAATTLNRLLADYPALNGPLPQVIYGNVLWARSSYSEAATIYRQALATPSDEQALLANNLGAILLDAGDPAVLSAFSETVRLLNGKDLGELRYNLGLLALANQNPTEAISNLEAARNLLNPSAPLLLSLTEAYRESGRLGSAANTLETAAQQVTIDQRQVPAIYQTMFSQRLDGAIREQRGMLGLARNLNAQGPLVWEVESAEIVFSGMGAAIST